MAFPEWYNVPWITRDSETTKRFMRSPTARLGKKKHVGSRVNPLSSNGLLFAISMVILLSAAALYSVNLRAIGDSAAPPAPPPPSPFPTPLITSSPTVIVTPSSVPDGTVGSTFTIQVTVQNMDQFNGWDIEVYGAPWVINATSLSITGNDFAVNASSGSAFEIVHCINGRGSGCTSSDGPGFVHSSYANTAVLTGNGLLFTITYQVIGNSAVSQIWYAYSPISLINDQILSPNSGFGVYHTSQSGTYGVFVKEESGSGGSHPRPD